MIVACFGIIGYVSHKPKDSLKWKVLKATDGYGLEHRYIQREDGFTLIREGIGREGQERYLAKSSFGDFEFFALRWDERGNYPLDEYIVYVKTPIRGDLAELRNETLIRWHAKDIESGLLRYPLIRIYDFIPVKKVWFDVSDFSDKSSYLVRAEEL